MTPDILSLAEEVLNKARGEHLLVATAESCTGGLVAGALTAIAGSSDVFERGFVTYSNEAKAEMLGVDPALIAAHGAVSREVAIAMAACALRQRGPVWKFSGQAFVGEDLCAEAEFGAMISDGTQASSAG